MHSVLAWQAICISGLMLVACSEGSVKQMNVPSNSGQTDLVTMRPQGVLGTPNAVVAMRDTSFDEDSRKIIRGQLQSDGSCSRPALLSKETSKAGVYEAAIVVEQDFTTCNFVVAYGRFHEPFNTPPGMHTTSATLKGKYVKRALLDVGPPGPKD